MVNCRSRQRPVIRRMLVTVRRPGARIALAKGTSACRQLRLRKSGANGWSTAAKRGDRRGMATSLGGDAPSILYPLRRLIYTARHSPAMTLKWPKSS